MKKTMVSLAAASLIVTSAMAADKGIDIVTTGQAVVYYQTADDNGASVANTHDGLFGKDASSANVGVQLNLDADLKNNFTLGTQLTYLGTAGLEKNLVNATRQGVTSNLNSTTDEIALTKLFIAKKIANTTVKVGRQELPKSLSPLAYSEGWNVFKNTFDAILVVNSDIPDTTLVGAYVSGGTGMNLTGTADLTTRVNVTGTLAGPGTAALPITSTAYMLTVQNKSVPMTTITGSYYRLTKIGEALPVVGIAADAFWFDAKVAGKDLPLGLKIGVQAGQIAPDSQYNNIPLDDTTAYGVKVGLKPVDALSICVAFTSVDGSDTKANVAIKNVGTGIKTPLYTQMVANQDAIALDGNTFMLKAVYNTGDYGKIIAQGTFTDAGKSNLMSYTDAAGVEQGNDYTDLELVYKIKAGGVQYLAAYIDRTWDKVDAGLAGVGQADHQSIVRFWARYNF